MSEMVVESRANTFFGGMGKILSVKSFYRLFLCLSVGVVLGAFITFGGKKAEHLIMGLFDWEPFVFVVLAMLMYFVILAGKNSQNSRAFFGGAWIPILGILLNSLAAIYANPGFVQSVGHSFFAEFFLWFINLLRFSWISPIDYCLLALLIFYILVGFGISRM